MSGALWWQTLLSVLAGGVLTLLGTVWVGRLNRKASGREEWFRRVQWAQQLTAAGDEATKVAGYGVLAQLSRSKLATEDDKEMLAQLVKDPDLDALLTVPAEAVEATDYVLQSPGGVADQPVDAVDDEGDNEGDGPGEGGDQQ